MESIKVKICGLTCFQDVEAALHNGANYLGFIVEAQSVRKLSVKQAAKLSSPAAGIAKCVAVTVNPSEKLLKHIANIMRPDYLQFHGQEDLETVRAAKRLTNIPIIKAIQIRTKKDLENARSFEGVTDYILLDAKPPNGARQQGGHGLNFEWNLLKGFTSKTPLILAGGLSARNIKAAKATGINFFDVSSGVESKAGVKDSSLIRDFMKAAHE
ncbi:MAG: phosphoribosylanthranilate isomerase [Robiginitomaculum sp.]